VKPSILDSILHRFGYSNRKYALVDRNRLKNLLSQLVPLDIDLQRIGDANDGGYLIPKELDLPTALFSPGVNDNDSFELFYAEKGVPCYLADFSVNKNPSEHPNLHFSKKYVGWKDEDSFIPLDSWVNESVGEHIDNLMLQMDIEGWEYNNIINVSHNILSRFNLVCIEFHGFYKTGYLHSFALMEQIFQKLLKHYVPVHIHANNCCGSEIIHDYVLPTAVEITFLNRNSKLISSKLKTRNTIYQPLDKPNVTDKDEIYLDSWLK
jgi:hypothetical protein